VSEDAQLKIHVIINYQGGKWLSQIYLKKMVIKTVCGCIV